MSTSVYTVSVLLVALARLIATGADVLLLDEPSSGVDLQWVRRILDLIRQLAAANGWPAPVAVQQQHSYLRRRAGLVHTSIVDDEQLARERAACRTKSAPHGNLMPPIERARKQKACEIRARQQQHQRHDCQ